MSIGLTGVLYTRWRIDHKVDSRNNIDSSGN